MKSTCIIIDDDPTIVDQISEYIKDTHQLTLLNSYTDSIVALNAITNASNKIDFLFTDIEMPGLTGLDLAKRIRHKIRFLVIITGHLQYALDGYDVQANGFLTKPISYHKFNATVNNLLAQSTTEKPFAFFKAKESREQVKLWIEEIIFIEANGNYVNINTFNKTTITLLKLSDIEEKLQPYKQFVRIHKSFIVSTHHIEKLQGNFVFLTNNKSLPISVTYKDIIFRNFD
ncbi:LytR/AlgR family response regulator transcription factor [Pedobacter sandarakinus]|uniref:LytR/AlgR family response regulator transcription factor n=1 Tax=Pedobacter sandarakinus TaxID=353156 RepID=UPI0022462C75|nr:LytTR family DNA-binding domain-containing protein [Pedobacter sandarakinus]MCX2573925.1 LytTR family DNA-binding domain-containing protein [Pedobacter sandarakinus]